MKDKNLANGQSNTRNRKAKQKKVGKTETFLAQAVSLILMLTYLETFAPLFKMK